MKPNIKVGSFLLAIVMMFSVLQLQVVHPQLLTKNGRIRQAITSLPSALISTHSMQLTVRLKAMLRSLTIMIRHPTSGLMKKSRTMTATSRLQESGLRIRLRKCASATS